MPYQNMDKSFQSLRELIDQKKRFVITSHINPDGDSIGSEIAMYNLLRDLGKEAVIINSSVTPDTCLFLEGAGKIIAYEHLSEENAQYIKKADALILVDVGEMKRVGIVSRLFKEARLFTICIDHHILTNASMDLCIVKDDACATGEIIYHFIKYCGYKMSVNIAEAIYVSIITDTGSFQHNNTNVESHMIAAELLSMGLNHSYIYERYYGNQPMRKVKLFISVISTLQTECDGRIAWMKLTRDMLNLTDANLEDSEGIINFALTIQGVEAILLFKELEDNKVKVSLRSRKDFNVRSIASAFGGGGHNNASGILLQGNLDEIIQKVLTKVQEELKK
jgi:bifunctional oligoribonuclease and PAP phosphatase NrnA